NMSTFPVEKNIFPISSSSTGFPVPFDLPPIHYSSKGTDCNQRRIETDRDVTLRTEAEKRLRLPWRCTSLMTEDDSAVRC
ncbi:tyrosyl-DNA phosphodiesterase 1, partial [Tachysurus ichikawai]